MTRLKFDDDDDEDDGGPEPFLEYLSQPADPAELMPLIGGARFVSPDSLTIMRGFGDNAVEVPYPSPSVLCNTFQRLCQKRPIFDRAAKRPKRPVSGFFFDLGGQIYPRSFQKGINA